MKKDLPQMEELMAKYFSGEAGQEEILLLSAWVRENEENRQLFTDTQKAWEKISEVAVEKEFDIDQEWKLISEKINKNRKPKMVQVLFGKSSFTGSFLRIAAVFAVLLGSIYLVRQFFAIPQTIEIIAQNDRVEATLPDGSNVSINKGSSISHAENFKINRHLKLKGEAQFDVAHDSEHPFVVEAGKVRIEALGTSFYVNNDVTNNKVTIVLMEGKIAVYQVDKPDDKMILLPGEKTEVSTMHDSLSISPKSVNKDQYFNVWKTRSMSFNDERLGNVAILLSKAYNKQVILKNKTLADCRITASFEDQSLESVLKVIETTLNLNVKISREKIEIDGNSCGQ